MNMSSTKDNPVVNNKQSLNNGQNSKGVENSSTDKVEEKPKSRTKRYIITTFDRQSPDSENTRADESGRRRVVYQ